MMSFGGNFKMKIKRGLNMGKLKISRDGKKVIILTERPWTPKRSG